LIAGACFHAQQCAEKYIKVLLVSKGADFPKTHDLLLLNNLCSDVGIFLEIDPMLLNNLADYAVRTRYPGEEPSLNDAKEAVETSKLIRAFARRFLGI
jgi:HEPN domain-containing protein